VVNRRDLSRHALIAQTTRRERISVKRLLSAALLSVLLVGCSGDPLDRAAQASCDALRDGYDLDLAIVRGLLELEEPTTDRDIDAIVRRMAEECGALFR